jgi:hypothetical protein
LNDAPLSTQGEQAALTPDEVGCTTVGLSLSGTGYSIGFQRT